MEVYEDLLNWARGQDIELHGIEPRPLSGRGIGVVSTKSIKENEVLLRVPTSALRTAKTVCKKVSSKLPTGSRVHGLLAADIILNPSPKYKQWNAVMPSREDVWASLPLTWNRRLHELLPRSARERLRKQETKFERDWTAIKQAFPDSKISRNDYLYAWALVNTRTFYYELNGNSKLHKDDRLALQPVADLLNHHDSEGCKVDFESDDCTITSTRAYAPGDEVYICYGNHGNDFLLAEYGFVLPQNRWDEVCLDDAILPKLSARQKEQLDEVGFLGNYMLDSNGVCYRTQVALRLICLPLNEWRRFVDGEAGAGGGDAERQQQEEVDRKLVHLLRKYQDMIRNTVERIKDSEVGQPCQRDLLCLRWTQIQSLMEKTIEKLDV
ncbi:hypothetical protein B0H66DRAFT_81304 [Apodospora peruviana]|uniref:SET domain-containing protein n=1 Tax=Apodospora peruviana TaxID=516989 RepID=A0AAE0ITY8_9PEZI|nr:hypothetical protein B0H66DRAFT_81304 [Apodospora peruviana]